MFNTLISVTALQSHLADPDWLIIDVRHDLRNPSAGPEAYAAGHIAGAQFLHLDDDLSAPKTGQNGRHPLPDAEAFATRLAQLGVNNQTQIIAYDADGGMYAARLWWMLRWLGHEAVAVLDGGWQAWLAANGAVERVTPERAAGAFTRRAPLQRVVTVDTVLAQLGQATQVIVDARAPDRFRGENETLDRIGGHIPGARNHFFRSNLDEDGRFKSADDLRASWLATLAGTPIQNIVAQCGSGVTACHNLLALEIAGLSGAALYAGSWSEWSSDATRPVEQG